MGIIAKGAKCNVDGCTNDGARSLNTTKVENAGLEVLWCFIYTKNKGCEAVA